MEKETRKVISSRRIENYNGYLYDITVTGNHSFQLANGAISHNCDFEPDARPRIKAWLKERFGENHCMDVSTLSGVAMKGSIADLARIYKVPPEEFMPVTTSIKYNPSNDDENKLEYIRETNKGVDEFLKKYPQIEKDISKMQNLIRGTGTHASAFIISSVSLDEYVPLIKNKEKELIVGYQESSHIKALDNIGLQKFDILGLESLTVNREAEKMIKDRYGITIDWEKVDINDPEVYSMVNKGYVEGTFQFMSSVARGIIDIIKPDCFNDLMAINSLMRPASLSAQAHITYKKHKSGEYDRTVFPVWKDLEGKVSDFTYKLLDKFYGVPCFQESVQTLIAEFCGISFDDTNKVRKVIGIPANKKKQEDYTFIEETRNKFIDGGTKLVGAQLAKQWWDTAAGSLSYGFNASHSAAYTLFAYRQLWLKRYYPKEFYCALLKQEVAVSQTNKDAKLMRYIVEARQLDVPVAAPHINFSKQDLDYYQDTIYIGLGQLKGLGDKAAEQTELNKPYTSFADFLAKNRVKGSKVNKTAIEALIFTDSFRDFAPRKQILEEWFRFNLPKSKKDTEFTPPSDIEIFLQENEYLTTVLSDKDPLRKPYGYNTITDSIDMPKGRLVKIKAIVDSKQTLSSRAGNKYMKLSINDLTNTGKVLVWKNFFKDLQDIQKYDIIQVQLEHLENDSFALKKVIKVEKQNNGEITS